MGYLRQIPRQILLMQSPAVTKVMYYVQSY